MLGTEREYINMFSYIGLGIHPRSLSTLKHHISSFDIFNEIVMPTRGFQIPIFEVKLVMNFKKVEIYLGQHSMNNVTTSDCMGIHLEVVNLQ